MTLAPANANNRAAMDASTRLCRIAALASLVVLAGCYEPSFTDCSKRCGASETCPAGLMCVNGRCSRGTTCPPPDDGGAAVDSEAGAVDFEAGTNDGGSPDASDVAPDASDGPTFDGGPDDPDGGDTDGGVDVVVKGDAGVDAEADASGTLADAGDSEVSDGPAREDSRDASIEDARAADAADGPEVAPPWTPRALGGLVVWLEADRGIEASNKMRVERWRDQSGNENHAFQGGVTNAPVLVPEAINRLPAVHFTHPSWLVIADMRSMRWGRDDFSVVIVERSARVCGSCRDPHIIFHKQGADAPFVGPGLYLMNPSGQFRSYFTDSQELRSVRGGYDDTAPHMIGMHRTASRVDLRVDGAPAGALLVEETVNVDAPGTNAYVGAHGAGGSAFQFEGDIAALIAVRGPLSDADVVALEDYLAAKYGVSTAAARKNPSQVAVGQNADGHPLVIHTDESGLLHGTRQAAAQSFETWTSEALNLRADKATRLALAEPIDGRVELVYLGLDGLLRHTSQGVAGDSWDDERRMNSPRTAAREMALARNGDGRLQVISIGTNSVLYQTAQVIAGGEWTGESLLDSPFSTAKSIVMDRNADDSLEAILIGTNDVLHYARQTSPGAPTWNVGVLHSPETTAQRLALGRNADGRLEIVYVGLDNALYGSAQVTAGGPWNDARYLRGRGSTAKEVAMGRNEDGRLEVLFVDSNDILQSARQVTAGGTVWDIDVLNSDAATARRLAVGRDLAGHLRVVFVGLDDRVYTSRQLVVNGTTWTTTEAVGDP